MRIYHSHREIADLHGRPRVVAIGTFDGVHLGHRAIIRAAAAAAKGAGGVSTALTFEPHPAMVLHPSEAPRILTPLEVKINLLEREELNETVVIPFDGEFSTLSPEAFCRLLLSERLGARQVLVGMNFRFGHRGVGTPEDLVIYGSTHGFSVTAVPLLEKDGVPVSSTRIRDLILLGKVAEAAVLLGRPHLLEGMVVAGVGRGRDLGVPTANLSVSPEVAVPALGVYVTRSVIPGQEAVPSVTNVGTNPTFESDGEVRVETFLFGFDGNLYGERMRVEFLERIRDQRTFPDASALLAQMHEDMKIAEAYFHDRHTPSPTLGLW